MVEVKIGLMMLLIGALLLGMRLSARSARPMGN